MSYLSARIRREYNQKRPTTQPAFTCSKLTIETLEQGSIVNFEQVNAGWVATHIKYYPYSHSLPLGVISKILDGDYDL